ncbi:MAG: Arc family DNA-binding protein [Dysgonamonadaceae bacterium]|nr:Arc family DNA-binding protein [Dysgonamonadaceae bacterium]
MAKEIEKEIKNKSFVLRIDNDMMSAIEKWACDEFRSVNGQILYLLNQALQKYDRIPKRKQ